MIHDIMIDNEVCNIMILYCSLDSRGPVELTANFLISSSVLHIEVLQSLHSVPGTYITE